MKRVYGKVLVLCVLLLLSVTALHAARLTLFIDGDNRTPYDASRGKVGRAEWTAAVSARKGKILTNDFNRALDMAMRLETGMVHIGDQTVNDEPQAPFGGVKGSGYGRFGGQAALDEFTELRWINVQRVPRTFP